MSEIKVDTLTGKTTANDITVTVGATATMSLEQTLAKAWVNFNGIGTIAQRDSLNVTSLTDDGVGQHSYSFVNNFNNADYTHTAGAGSGSYSTGTLITVRTYGVTPTTSTIGCNTFLGNTSTIASYDATYVASTNHGDLA